MHKTLFTVMLGLAAAGSAYADRPERFHAHLRGGDLAGRPIVTGATGEARFEVVDGFRLVNGSRATTQALEYRINVAGINNLFMAHIHVAANGPVADNQPVGPVVFWFVPTTPPAAPNSNVADTVNGRLADGFVMTDGQIVGPLACNPVPECSPETGVAGLIKAIKEGRATVVVHTSDLDNTNNQTPGLAGDSPAGEIRGLIK